MHFMDNMEYDFWYTTSGEERVAYGLKSRNAWQIDSA